MNSEGRTAQGFAIIFKVTSKNVIPAKAGIQKPLTSLDSRLRGSDKLIIIRGSLNLSLLSQSLIFNSNKSDLR